MNQHKKLLHAFYYIAQIARVIGFLVAILFLGLVNIYRPSFLPYMVIGIFVEIGAIIIVFGYMKITDQL